MLGQKHEITSADGSRLWTYRASGSGRPAVVLFNAVGIPHPVFDRISARLGDRFAIVTWETRELPSPPVEAADGMAGLRHVEDAAAVFDHFGIGSAHIVGWCSGADVAVLFHLRHRSRVESLVLISGAYGFLEDGLWSEYEAKLTRVLTRYLRNPGIERGMHGTLLRLIEPQVAGGATGEDEALRSILLYPLQTPERLRRYAHLCLAIKRDRRVDTFPCITAPTLYIAGTADPVQPYQATVRAHELTAASRLVLVPGGDHNLVYTSQEVAGAVEDFITR